MAARGLSGRLQRVGSTSPAEIVMTYANITPYGSAWVDGVNGCLVHSVADNDTVSAQIYVDIRTDWFTQENERRAYWETECPNGTWTAYTCVKLRDYGSLITH